MTEDLSKLTVVQLKERLVAKSLPTSGKKADLIERLKQGEAEAKEPEAAEEPAEVAAEKAADGAAVDAEAGGAADAPQEKAPADEQDQGLKAEGGAADEAGEAVEGAGGAAAKGDENAAAAAKGEEAAKEGGAKAEEGDAKDEDMKEEPAQGELEQDAPEDARARLGAAVQIGAAPDATLNVMPTCGGKVLMQLADNGFQYLAAAARANVGVKAGRYLFEVRIVESKTFPDTSKTKPRQSCTVGFSTKGSSLFLGDGEDNFGFDSGGYFVAAGQWSKKLCDSIDTHAVLGVLLNLEPGGPNANTVSLFKDGERLGKPQAIPEGLRGKVLYPTVTYKNMTVHMNFGPSSFTTMPFTCRMLQDAAAADVEVGPAAAGKAPAKSEVLFPIGLPDEGTYTWLDGFLKENPQHAELSHRAIAAWGEKSGLYRNRINNYPMCNDSPNPDFQVREIDDHSLQNTLLRSLAPMLPRDYVVMQVRNNLLAAERKTALAAWDSGSFKRVAAVVVGEPPEAFKALAQQQLLAEKRRRLGGELRRQKEAEAKTQKEKRRALAEEKLRGREERKRAREEEKKAKGEDAGEEEAMQDESDAEEPAEEPEEDIEEAVRKAMEGVQLTEEEKKQNWFVKGTEDITQRDFSRCFGQFSLPDEAEGFDEIRYVWQNAEKSAEYLKGYIAQRKLTQRVEDVQPGKYFQRVYDEWRNKYKDWKQRLSEYRSKADETKRNQQRTAATARDAKRRKVEEASTKDEARGDEETPKEGEAEDKDKEAKEETKEAKEVEEEAKEEPVEEAKEPINAADVDPFLVENIDDIGNGEPLYANFTWEDWVMLSLRFEIHLLVHSFREDVNDAERLSFAESHLGFYYSKYYKRTFSTKVFGVASNLELLATIKDTIEVLPQSSILDAQLDEDTPLDNFVRLAEDHRRERKRRYDAGDESALLQLQRETPAAGARDGGRDGRRADHGGGYGRDRRGGGRDAYPASGGGRYGGGGGGGGRDSRGGYDGHGRGGDGGKGYPARVPPPGYPPPPPPGYSGVAVGAGYRSYGGASQGSRAPPIGQNARHSFGGPPPGGVTPGGGAPPPPRGGGPPPPGPPRGAPPSGPVSYGSGRRGSDRPPVGGPPPPVGGRPLPPPSYSSSGGYGGGRDDARSSRRSPPRGGAAPSSAVGQKRYLGPPGGAVGAPSGGGGPPHKTSRGGPAPSRAAFGGPPPGNLRM